jgi:hypothetical protein
VDGLSIWHSRAHGGAGGQAQTNHRVREGGHGATEASGLSPASRGVVYYCGVCAGWNQGFGVGWVESERLFRRLGVHGEYHVRWD